MLGTGEMDSMVLEVGVGWGAIESTVLFVRCFSRLAFFSFVMDKTQGDNCKKSK